MKTGIFAGTFDPVHNGHVQFALGAVKQAKLDKVYLLPERNPRHKVGITHYAHRLAMLKLVAEKSSNLEVLDMPDRLFTVAKTLPRLNQKFTNDELFLLVGSDVMEHIGEWPLVDSLFSRMNLIVGVRQGSDKSLVDNFAEQLPTKNQVLIIHSPASDISAVKIREKVGANKKPTGIDPAVYQYIKTNWLYSLV